MNRGAWWRWPAVDPVRLGIRLAFVVAALAAVGWDLPSSFSWDNDGVAPRDIFAGVAENLIPGHAFRYPLLHPLLVGLLCLPVLLPAAAGAASWRMADLRAAILTPAVMTPCTLLARALAIAAAVMALAALGRIAATLAGRRAARWSEAFAATNLSFAYYGHATNLDGPALMWSALAVEALLAACTRARRGDAIRFALFAAASVATKDQAYATYVLLVPALLALLRWRPEVFAAGAWSPRTTARAGATFAAAYLLGSGAAFNPGGLPTRVRTLVGPASGAYRAYEASARGVAANLRDVLGGQADTFWPWPVVAAAWIGVALTLISVARDRRGHTAAPDAADAPAVVWRLLPLAAGLGTLLAFVLAVGRAEHRFVLPLGFWLSFYAGVAVAAASGESTVPQPWTARGVAATLAAVILLIDAVCPVVALGATQRGDGRRTVEVWLRRQPAGTTVETYGPLVYLPRFAPPTRATRVGADPVALRNPMPGMDELQAAIADAPLRRPDVIVMSEGFALPHLADSGASPSPGRLLPGVWQTARSDTATTAFVRAAIADTLPNYRTCLVAGPALPAWIPPAWAPRPIHVSTGLRTWVLARRDRRLSHSCREHVTPCNTDPC